ncbi:hypothetical protein COB11_07110, partial [Candidatus Aerophobetes bacterium]
MRFSVFLRVLTVILCSFTLLTEAAIDYQRVYVSNLYDDTVSVINKETNAAGSTISVGEGPAALAVTPDGLRVYV